MRFLSQATDVAEYHAAVELFFERGWSLASDLPNILILSYPLSAELG